MKVLLRAIGRLPRWQRAMIIALVAMILLTWLATCLVLAGYLS